MTTTSMKIYECEICKVEMSVALKLREIPAAAVARQREQRFGIDSLGITETTFQAWREPKKFL